MSAQVIKVWTCSSSSDARYDAGPGLVPEIILPYSLALCVFLAAGENILISRPVNPHLFILSCSSHRFFCPRSACGTSTFRAIVRPWLSLCLFHFLAVDCQRAPTRAVNSSYASVYVYWRAQLRTALHAIYITSDIQGMIWGEPDLASWPTAAIVHKHLSPTVHTLPRS